MYLLDKDKTTFKTEGVNFCYMVIPLDVGVTY